MVKRVTWFKTDADGKPILADRVVLYGNTRYDRVPRRVYGSGRLVSREHVADWIRNAVLGDLGTLDFGMRKREVERGGGNFLLLVGCLTALEYLATIFDGDEERSSVGKMANYASTFMKNTRYAKCMQLLVDARNGAAHGSWPVRVSVKGQQYPFAIGFEKEYPDLKHLHLMPYKTGENDDPKETLFVNPRVLLADLVASVENGFADWIRNASGDEALKRAQPFVIDRDESYLDSWRKE